MEIEKPKKAMTKKWWNILRIMSKLGLLKSKLMLDLNFIVKRGGNAMAENLLLHRYYSALTCRSDDGHFPPFITPREYEFSCSNSPAAFLNHRSRRKNRHHNRHHHGQGDGLVLVRKVFDLDLNCYDTAREGLSSPALPVRQLRITDSPFSMKDGADHDEENRRHQVDMDAEEFIKKFYQDLKNQRRFAALESPSPCHLWGR